MSLKTFTIFIFFICHFSSYLCSQENLKFIVPSDSFNQQRFNSALTFTGVTYLGFSIGLYNIWYRKYEQSPIHFFNDWNEWNNMDKMGHFYSAYFQGNLCYQGAKWSGLSKKKSIITGVAIGSLFQSTLEVMDGFSEKWGFSVFDVGFNTAGISAFALQQWYWDEQRIMFKVSGYKHKYATSPIYSTNGIGVSTLDQRANKLFGSTFAERLLKDYNTQTIWASVNIYSFLPKGNNFPKWLNLAFGTSSENMYGGFNNSWIENGDTYTLDKTEFPRYRQFFLGLDVDLKRLPIDNYYWNTILSVLNIYKLPGPAIELNSLGEFKLHLIHF